MVTIVLMNLLNGLAVTDITAIVNESEVLHQTSMINMLEYFEHHAMNNRKGLETISQVCPCLRPLLLKMFDLSEDLLLFSTGKTSDMKKDDSRKIKTLSHVEKEDISSRDCMRRYMCKYLGDPKKVGCGHIISQARDILLRAKKSRMDKRAMTNRQTKEKQDKLKEAQEDRRRQAALITESMMRQQIVDPK